MSTKRKFILYVIGIMIIIYLAVYTVLTPFVRGVVVDETTKQPVENAWVMATATIGTRTIAGDTGGTHAISSRHLKTSKNGVFYVFPRLYLSIPTPYTFGNMKKDLIITVRVMDGRRAEVDLTKHWWMRILFVKIPVGYVLRKDEVINSELRSLYSYCTNGMYFPIYRSSLELCDDWELEYTIVMHEKFIKELGQTSSVDQDVLYVGAMGRLAYLYKQKGDFKKALETFVAVRDFEKKYKQVNLSGYETKINELKKKLDSR